MLYYRYNNVLIIIIMIGPNFPSIENLKSHTPHMLMRLVVSSRLFVSGAIETLRCRGVFGDPRSSECRLGPSAAWDGGRGSLESRGHGVAV